MSLKDSSPRRSQNPAPFVAERAAAESGGDTGHERHYNRRTRRLMARFHGAVPANVREFLQRSVPEDAALRLGRRHAPDEYVHGFLLALETFAPHILAGQLPGYGPLRARYGLDLVREISPLLEKLGGQRGDVRAAATEYARAVGLTDAQRLDAAVALQSVLGSDAAAAQRLQEVAPRSRATRERILSAEEVAAEAQRAKEEVPEELLRDAGLTPAVLGSLEDTARKAVDTGVDRQEKRTAAQQLRAQLAAPCGRVLHELKVLLAAARRARAKDPAVPQCTPPLLQPRKAGARRTRAPSPAPAPVTPPTPALER